MSRDQKGSPEDGGTDGEMVFEVTRASAVLGSGPPVFIDARLAEAFVGMPIVFGWARRRILSQPESITL